MHATVAAILMAFTIPARSRVDGEAFVKQVGEHLEALRVVGLPRGGTVNTGLQQDVLEAMDRSVEEASAPLQELQRALDPLVVFVVLPIFALANAGVSIGGDLESSVVAPVSLGVLAGLFFGKQIGVALFAWLAVRLKIADLPRGVGWGALYGVAILAGIGFTMSLFIASLAFDEPLRLEQAKVGILTASLFSGLVGLALLRFATRRPAPAAAQST
ncbi:MAG: Na+/H+ antiporter NhaA [Sandaracinaceae bacterium]|nr:Na+/H+ antiporter NhaA [Sandaracinaceae bacterium]